MLPTRTGSAALATGVNNNAAATTAAAGKAFLGILSSSETFVERRWKRTVLASIGVEWPHGDQLLPHRKPARDPRCSFAPSAVVVRAAHVGDGRRGPVEFGDRDLERLVVGHGAVLQNAQRNLLAQQNRPESRAAEVDASVNSVTKRNVVRQLVQFSVDIQAVAVCTGIGIERQAVAAGHN